MNDRYLCKAKRKDNGEWVEGFFTIEWVMKSLEIETSTIGFKKTYCIKGFPSSPNEAYFWVEIDPETLCRCTGLKDYNDSLIWENDIVLFDDEFWYIGWSDEDAYFTIEHDGVIENFGNVWSEDCEVYGNIFDNGDLLYPTEDVMILSPGLMTKQDWINLGCSEECADELSKGYRGKDEWED